MHKKNTIKKKNLIISASAFAVILIILFAPLPWVITIPCIVDSLESKVIYINQDGFLNKFKVENYQKVKKGELLFTQDNPYLNYADSIQKIMLNTFKTELDQQRTYFESSIPDNIKIQQILNTQNEITEISRKQQSLNIKSPINGTFILFDWHLQSGKWLSKGEPIGEVFSENNVVVSAYAEEAYFNKIHLNDKCKIFLNNDIQPYYGKVVKINPVPSKLWQPSPLLSTAGGPIEVLKQEPNYTFLLRNYYYQIVIQPDLKYTQLKYSRTGNLKLRVYSSIGLNFIRKVIKIIQRELTF